MRWVFREADSSEIARLASEAGIAPIVARILLTRGIRTGEEAERFLSPSLAHLHSPYLMSGMNAAVDRLRAAIERREPILIYGDYDVDGTTAIVILRTAIELCGGSADCHVPHRIREGYGMKEDVIERAAAAGTRLIISVDTGIRAFAAAEAAKRAGVDLIVTDHHLPEASAGVPAALAVLNPNQADCSYPCKALCGAGVAFKLAQALLEKNGRERLLPSFLKMVAIATVADAVPLQDENRVFASLGLDGLRKPVNLGLKALLEVAALGDSRPLTATDIAFRIAPRLNAAGRMDVALDVIDLFGATEPAKAQEIAARLNQLNVDRQLEERRIMQEIEERVDSHPALAEAYCVVLDGEGWHRGVIGIAATRVVERWGRPALVISAEAEEAHGSGRSIRGFHLLDALESCRTLFDRFGGHAHAVGFALPTTRIAELRSTLDAYARSRLTPADFEPVLEPDGELPLREITPQLYRELCRLEPFGIGNPEPVFRSSVRLLQPARVIKEKHAKLRVAEAGSNRSFAAMGWRMAERMEQAGLLAGDSIEIAFKLEHNDHPDFGGLELCLEDVAIPARSASVSGN
jgi:single-stranded-DNA-specific exonuclease